MKIEEILRKRHLYANIPNLKYFEAKFFLEKIEDKYNEVNILSPKRLKSFTGKEIHEAGVDIAYYSSAFYSAVAGFFDSLAILHTANRERWYRKIHFRHWLSQQLKRHPSDQYLIELKDNLNTWLEEFLNSRNLFVHSFHVFAATKEFFHLEGDARQGTKVKMYEVETTAGSKQIARYFEEIIEKMDTLLGTVNNHLENEYKYKPLRNCC